MSNAAGPSRVDRPWETPADLPQAPPPGTSRDEAGRQTQQHLQSFLDKLNSREWSPATTKTAIRRYVQSVINSLDLPDNLDATIKPWYDSVDDYERRLNLATNEGGRRSNTLQSNNGHRDTSPGGHDEDARSISGRERRRRNRDDQSDEEDDEDELRSPKKVKQDVSKFGWAADSAIKRANLSPRHREVISLVENYSADVDSSIEHLESSGTNPYLPRKQWKFVLRDQYVELSEVLAAVTSYHSGDVQRGNGSALSDALEGTTLAKPAASKPVLDQVNWRRAWRAVYNAILFAFPNRRKELDRYEDHIQKLFDGHVESNHSNILRYDRAVRAIIGSRRDLLYDDYTHEDCSHCFTMYVTTTGANPKRFVENSTAGTAVDVTGNMFATIAKNPDMVPTLAQTNKVEKTTEPGASFFSTSRFWKSAVSCLYGAVVEDKKGADVTEVEKSSGERMSFLLRFMRGLGFRWDSKLVYSKTAWYTEMDKPLPRPPAEEYEGVAWRTIQENPNLFETHTPISPDRLGSLLNNHPNPSFVESVLTTLREGLWPWANTRPSKSFPETWDNAWAPLPSLKERDFIDSQCEVEVEAKRHSPAFGPELFPGMYSTPVFAVPKPHTDTFRLVVHQSAGEYCQNNMVDRDETRGARMDNLLVFIPLLLAFARAHPSEKLVIWKSDVSSAFRLVPVHPLWQIRQVVTAGMPTKEELGKDMWDRSRLRRHVDWSACFGNRGSPRAWASVMGLVIWIAIFILHILLLCCYVDDCFSVALARDLDYYEPYSTWMPREQVALLRLWDFLGIPHKAAKQLWGSPLAIIGFFVDPNALTATLPPDSKSDLVLHVREFAASRRRSLTEWQQLAGWMNWSFNVFPLLRPALSNVYAKIGGKTKASALIYVNKAVRNELVWFADHVETLSGVLFFASIDWNPFCEADIVIFCDACLEGMGFWVPSNNTGFMAVTDPSSPMAGVFSIEKLLRCSPLSNGLRKLFLHWTGLQKIHGDSLSTPTI
ncbi:hypothetical protein K435DRAFT_879754 [Dendrothele bispora CBS 962.96]|uniref:Reverse transcriptase domain-containing protein n=1 Tax=Dendrothele bispora (strain CBS 962.96) TaxID=1314807 RepID=A0A4S8KKR2_DENBC|nr:hypothetical protein K435DRAFT_879754 [Dendrothele bispora CBS 962.96]